MKASVKRLSTGAPPGVAQSTATCSSAPSGANPVTAQFTRLVDFPPAPKLTEKGTLDRSQATPAAGTPYQRQKGGVYGSQLCFPLPDVERANNPNA